MLQEFHAFLLTIYHDFIEMGSAQLLRFDNKIILSFVSEVDVHLILMHNLGWVCVHLSNMRWLQILNSSNKCSCLIEKVSADTRTHTLYRLSMIGLLCYWLFGIWSLLWEYTNLLMTSLLQWSSWSERIEIFLHHSGVWSLEIGGRCCLRLKLEKVWSTSLRDLHFVLRCVISTVKPCGI